METVCGLEVISEVSSSVSKLKRIDEKNQDMNQQVNHHFDTLSWHWFIT